jgi:ParB-like chromosome segregation protein Spo0J
VKAIAESIQAFGFTTPVLIDDDGMILAGHGRLQAARLLGLEKVPAIRISALSEAQKRAFILAENKLAERAGWDRELLAVELGAPTRPGSTMTIRHAPSGWCAKITRKPI